MLYDRQRYEEWCREQTDLQAANQSAAASGAVSSGYLLIGGFVIVTALVTLAIKFSVEDEKLVKEELQKADKSVINLSPSSI